MSNALVAKYQTERDAVESQARDILDEAEAQNRDLTEDELTRLEGIRTRSAELDRQIEMVADDFSQRHELAAKVSKIGRLDPAVDFSYRSAGQLVWDLLHQNDDQARDRYNRAMRSAESPLSQRAAEHMGTLASATVATAGDLAGLVMVPGVGAIINPHPAGMPFLNLLGLRRIPSASFNRPYINDPNFESGVDKQTKQKAELVSKAFTVGHQTLTPETYGGYLNVSQQLIELVPDALGIIIGQLRRRLAHDIETAAVTEVGQTTGKETLAADADAAATLKAIYGAAAKVLTATQEPATWILMGPLGFARLGALADAAGRPMFPYMGPANAPGTSTANTFTSNVAGLRAVVTPAITDDAIYVGNGLGLEGWWYPLPVLEAVEPSVLGRQVAVAAMFAPWRPTPTENSIIKLAPST